jgi:hypothetical protein
MVTIQFPDGGRERCQIIEGPDGLLRLQGRFWCFGLGQACSTAGALWSVTTRTEHGWPRTGCREAGCSEQSCVDRMVT